MQFEFATATRILFAPGALRQVGGIVKEMGAHALIVKGRAANDSIAEELSRDLNTNGVDCFMFSVPHEPTTHLVAEGTQLARQNRCDLVISLGGGSSLDAGKAIAALLGNGGEPLDYLEVVGKGQSLTRPSAPFVAIPTTAGTGTEVTRNAVLDSPEHKVKASMRSPTMLPRLAVVDPELTYHLPPPVTASTGLDALTQVIEPFVTKKANPLIDSLCREGMRRAGRSLQQAYQHGDDKAAREDMCVVSLFGGLALANAGLGAVHGFAGPLGGALHAPHGAICARILPLVMECNVKAYAAREPESPMRQRFDEIARLLTGNEQAHAADGVAWIQDLCQLLNVPPLSAYGMTTQDIPDLVEKSAVSSSMKGNPIQLTRPELTEILSRAL